jgi:hypothetical protein
VIGVASCGKEHRAEGGAGIVGVDDEAGCDDSPLQT